MNTDCPKCPYPKNIGTVFALAEPYGVAECQECKTRWPCMLILDTDNEIPPPCA